MGRNNFVYEDLLKKYLEVRNTKMQKEANAATQIEQAEKAIEQNKAKMAECITTGDQEGYTALFTANNKNEASISFFRGVLAALKKDDSCNIDTAELQRKAYTEIARIIDKYNEECIKLMQPVIELSASTAMQINILRLAIYKIAKNLDHADNSTIDGACQNYNYNGLDLMKQLDHFLQSEPYKKTSGVRLDSSIHGIPRYEWDGDAYRKYNIENTKWI